MICKICASHSKNIFEATILGKYKVQYFQCENCDFIQTENPFWIQEAYEFEKTELDVGVVYRNLLLSNQAEELICRYYNTDGNFLDFAGGSGLFVRLMRDKGLNFFWADKYSRNIFARFFELDSSSIKNLELITAFEVIEHFTNPMEELENLLKFSRNILFSTELIPENGEIANWWYIVPEGGQHIAFFNKKTFLCIADKFDLNFYSNGNNLHLFSDRTFKKDPFEAPPIGKVLSILQRLNNKFFKRKKATSLLQKDFDYIKSKIIQNLDACK